MPIWLILIGVVFWFFVFWLGDKATDGTKSKESREGWNASIIIIFVAFAIILVILGAMGL